MFKAVIAGYSRSPFTMAKKGELIDIKPVNMLAEVIKSLTTKSKINKEDKIKFERAAKTCPVSLSLNSKVNKIIKFIYL